MKPYLKWPGGKSRLAQRILGHVGPGGRLVEPFVGSAAVFLQSGYEQALLADLDPDLVGLHTAVRDEPAAVLAEAGALFVAANNSAEVYARLRAEFNAKTAGSARQAALMLYLNRHCFNGLWRRNGRGEMNVSFGAYAAPEVPAQAVLEASARMQAAEIRRQTFEETFEQVRAGDAVYADPPYVALSETADFTGYAGPGFDWSAQERLAALAAKAASEGVRVVVSNHDTAAVRALYQDAFPRVRLVEVQVARSIAAAAGKRSSVGEVFAVFEPRAEGLRSAA